MDYHHFNYIKLIFIKVVLHVATVNKCIYNKKGLCFHKGLLMKFITKSIFFGNAWNHIQKGNLKNRNAITIFKIALWIYQTGVQFI